MVAKAKLGAGQSDLPRFVLIAQLPFRNSLSGSESNRVVK
jgi:hypothetical protein